MPAHLLDTCTGVESGGGAAGSQGAGSPENLRQVVCMLNTTYIHFPISCALNSLLVIKRILVYSAMLT